MSESKKFPNRNFITMKEQKAKKNIRNLQKNVIIGYAIYWSISFKTFLDMFLIFQIFDRYVNMVKKNFNPDDA